LISISTFIIFIVLCTTSTSLAQENKEISIGISMGWGTQNAAPFNSINYSHEVLFIKGQLNKDL